MLGPARIWPESTFISNEATFYVHVSAIPRYTMGSGVIVQISPFPAIIIAVKISFPCPRQKQAYFKDDMPMSCYNLHCTLYHNVGRREKKNMFFFPEETLIYFRFQSIHHFRIILIWPGDRIRRPEHQLKTRLDAVVAMRVYSISVGRTSH